jgi:hypothetical protein
MYQSFSLTILCPYFLSYTSLLPPFYSPFGPLSTPLYGSLSSPAPLSLSSPPLFRPFFSPFYSSICSSSPTLSTPFYTSSSYFLLPLLPFLLLSSLLPTPFPLTFNLFVPIPTLPPSTLLSTSCPARRSAPLVIFFFQFLTPSYAFLLSVSPYLPPFHPFLFPFYYSHHITHSAS